MVVVVGSGSGSGSESTVAMTELSALRPRGRPPAARLHLDPFFLRLVFGNSRRQGFNIGGPK